MKWKHPKGIKKKICMLLAASLIMAGADGYAGNVSEVNAAPAAQEREVLNFNTDWLYSSMDYENGFAAKMDDSGFEEVSVPHANTVLETHKGNDFPNEIASYRFVSWYRRHFSLPASYAGRHITVDFEGVATNAQVYLNGVQLGNHKGAYTGFSVDITDVVRTDGTENVLAVRVDSQRQPQVPPEGGNVDYCLFGGIVRDVTMTVTDPVRVERVFVTTPNLTKESGTVNNSVDIFNYSSETKTYTVETTVLDKEGQTLASASKEAALPAGKETNVEMDTEAVSNPHLWDVDDPYLYTAVTTIKDGNTEIDTYSTRFGMRYFEFKTGPDDGQFYLNGKKMEIIGINRHEQWPWIGRAVPDKLQIQDADLIKANGINAVRCSHYPQDPSFLDRCDEIGLLVVEEPPGWQHVGTDEWKVEFKHNLEELILRDRNHASIISWGARPNESSSKGNLPFNRECEAISKALDPTRPTHGVRWEFGMPGAEDSDTPDNDEVVNDILTVNYRYPENPPHIPYMVTEHSNDWRGDGFSWAKDAEAMKFIDSFAEPLDYFYQNDKVAGGFGWSMFDYDNEVNYTNTGHVFYSGLYDIFRQEKPVSYLYKSQMEPGEHPVIYISNSWTREGTNTDKVYVMSNCDEIELFVNNVSKGKITPNKYRNLPHPVFEFTGISYEAGELKAVGYIDGKNAGEYVRKTAETPVRLTAEADYSTLTADGTDMTSVSVTAVDADGNRVPFANNRINVSMVSPADGADATLISERNMELEGGRGAFLVQSKRDAVGTVSFEVTAEGLEPVTVDIKIDPFTANNLVPAAGRTGNIAPLFSSAPVINDSRRGDGLYQFSYQGNGWVYGGERTAFQGDNHYSNTAGDACSIRFIGTNLKYYGAKAPNHGIAAFSIDGGQETLIDCYSADRNADELLFDTADLEYGEHVLTVRVTGDKNGAASDNYLNVDRAVVTAKASGTVVNDDVTGTGELQFNYSNGWSSSQSAGCYQGNNHWTDTKDAYLEFKFTGTSVKYYTQKAYNLGIAAFSIDGGEETMVDLYQHDLQDQAMVYEAGSLAPGTHTLKVRVTGQKSPNNAENDYFVVVADRIDVFNEEGETEEDCSHENITLINQTERCTQSGYSGDRRCSDCGKLIETGAAVQAAGHQWGEWKTAKEPSYSGPGTEARICARCGDVETRDKAKIDCNHEGTETEIKDAKEASCTQAGSKGNSYCKRCGEKIADGEVIPALGHDWGEWKTDKEADYQEAGTESRTCTRCSEKDTRELPKLTCNHEGTETEIKDAKEASCTEAGFTGNTYCKRCGEKIAAGAETAALGHQWNSGVITRQPTTEAEGIRTYTCTRCKTETKTETIPKLSSGQQPGTTPKPPVKGEALTDKSSKAVYKVADAKVVNGKVIGSVVYTRPSQASLKTVKIPASVTINGGTYKVTSIAAKAFRNNKKLTKVTIGNNVASIGSSAFSGCTKLKTVTIGKNATTIGNHAFQKCTSLTKITISSKVKKIGKQAFAGNKKLKNITIKTTKLTKKSVGSKAFQGISGKAVFKVPKSKLKSYKSILKARGAGKKVKIRK